MYQIVQVQLGMRGSKCFQGHIKNDELKASLQKRADKDGDPGMA